MFILKPQMLGYLLQLYFQAKTLPQKENSKQFKNAWSDSCSGALCDCNPFRCASLSSVHLETLRKDVGSLNPRASQCDVLDSFDMVGCVKHTQETSNYLTRSTACKIT